MSLKRTPLVTCLGFVLLFAAANGAAAQRPVKAPDIRPAEEAPASVYYERNWFDYYDARLKALGEPSLWELSKNPNNEAFRFFYVPDSGNAIVIRIDTAPDGSAILTEKRSSGREGETWGRVIGELSRPMTEDELKEFRFRLSWMKYWYTERTDDENQINMPGPLWLFEAIEGGKYHAIERTNPSGGETRKLGLLVLSFIGLDEPDVAWPKRPGLE